MLTAARLKIAALVAAPRNLAIWLVLPVAALIMAAMARTAGWAPLGALGLTLLLAGMPFLMAWRHGNPGLDDEAFGGVTRREDLVRAIDRALSGSARRGKATAVLVLEIDRFKLLEERLDHAAIGRILAVTCDRIRGELRENDLAARLDGPSFGVALSPVRRLDLEAAIQLSARLQQALAVPIEMAAGNVYVTASVGFSIAARLDHPTGERLLQTATTALIEAQRSGPSAIRSFSDAMRHRVASRNSLADEVAEAMDKDEICAHFQPQLATATGLLSGFEALARWAHPSRGLIPPVEFLPAMEQAGLMERLGEIMIRQGLSALRHWDDIGLSVPRVAVNFSTTELRNPRLVERIGWELDRFDLSPDRLAIEVLETVVADRSEDIVIRNLSGLSQLGCCLDLDDFGTGHASITNIRRFSIERIKIDRSFITHVDEDPEQQKMVAAILTMAERLGLDTLAEGVETAGEQVMLRKLGCGHVQGFGIARPMPMSETDAWITHYRDLNKAPIPFPRRAV